MQYLNKYEKGQILFIDFLNFLKKEAGGVVPEKELKSLKNYKWEVLENGDGVTITNNLDGTIKAAKSYAMSHGRRILIDPDEMFNDVYNKSFA
mgnify:CR=1 FL=1